MNRYLSHTLLSLTLLSGISLALPALQAQDPHAVLDKGAKATGLAVADVPPFHLKANYTIYDVVTGKSIESGAMEEWASGPNVWHRVYTEKKLTGQEWSTAKTKLMKLKDNKLDVAHLDLAVARPLIDPVFYAPNFKPSVEMSLQAGTFAGLTLDCVSAANPALAAGGVDPDAMFPRLCFDVKDSTLKFITSSNTMTAYSDFKALGSHSVAGKVEIKPYNRLGTEITVTTLEPLGAADQAQVTPPGNAVEQPYPHVLADGMLVPVRITECAYPMDARDSHEHGPVSIPVIIKKDGSVKPNGPGMGPTHLSMAIGDCVSNYKFEPFKVDGEPTDISDVITYDYESKAFTPSMVTIGSQPPPPPAKK